MKSSGNSIHRDSQRGYQHVRGLHLIISVNQNVPSCAAAGTNNGCRPNPHFANDSQYSPLADSHYDALHISFLQRPSRWGNYRVSYTYSKALDNVGEFFFSSPINNFNIWQDYGRSDDDQRQRFVFDGSIHSPLSRGATAWEKLSHGFSLMLFSSTIRPYRSTSQQERRRSRERPPDPPSTALLSTGMPARDSTL